MRDLCDIYYIQIKHYIGNLKDYDKLIKINNNKKMQIAKCFGNT